MCAPLAARAGTRSMRVRRPWPCQRESVGRRERCLQQRERGHGRIPRWLLVTTTCPSQSLYQVLAKRYRLRPRRLIWTRSPIRRSRARLLRAFAGPRPAGWRALCSTIRFLLPCLRGLQTLSSSRETTSSLFSSPPAGRRVWRRSRLLRRTLRCARCWSGSCPKWPTPCRSSPMFHRPSSCLHIPLLGESRSPDCAGIATTCRPRVGASSVTSVSPSLRSCCASVRCAAPCACRVLRYFVA